MPPETSQLFAQASAAYARQYAKKRGVSDETAVQATLARATEFNDVKGSKEIFDQAIKCAGELP